MKGGDRGRGERYSEAAEQRYVWRAGAIGCEAPNYPHEVSTCEILELEKRKAGREEGRPGKREQCHRLRVHLGQDALQIVVEKYSTSSFCARVPASLVTAHQ